jgi:hypothetical protein
MTEEGVDNFRNSRDGVGGVGKLGLELRVIPDFVGPKSERPDHPKHGFSHDNIQDEYDIHNVVKDEEEFNCDNDDDADWDCVYTTTLSKEEDSNEHPQQQQSPGKGDHNGYSLNQRTRQREQQQSILSLHSSNYSRNIVEASTRPIVWIDVRRLLGYIPTDYEQEIIPFRQQLQDLLWTDEGTNNGSSTIWETGMARHDEIHVRDPAPITKYGGRFLAMEYPETTHVTLGNGQEISITELWKQLVDICNNDNNGSDHPDVVQRLYNHVRWCSLDVRTKYEMLQYWHHVVVAHETRYMQRRAWYQWKHGQRQARLKELYEIRNQFAKPLETQQSLLQQWQRQQKQQTHSMQSPTSPFHEFLDDDLWNEPMIGWYDNDEDDDVEQHEHAAIDRNRVPDSNMQHANPNETPHPNPPQPLQQHPTASQHGIEEDAKWRLRSAVVTQLQKKLESIDQLLETLQEEEWADEEEQEMANRKDRYYALDPDDDDDDDCLHGSTTDECETETSSMLEDVLRMVLGATPPPFPDSNHRDESTEMHDDFDSTGGMEQHIEYLESEHQEIMEEWRAHFGRLPQPPRRSPMQLLDQQTISFSRTLSPKYDKEQLRKTLGIVDNEEESWDNDYYDD